MIKNEREYRITKAQLENFRKALAALKLDTAQDEQQQLASELQEAALRSQFEELEEDVQEYERLLTAQPQDISVESIEELPTALIKARIASRLTQADLARQLGIPEQQIQRYEATNYAGASLKRINEISNALALRIQPRISIDHTPSSFNEMYRKIAAVGITRDFVQRWVMPPATKDAEKETIGDFDLAAIASRIARVFGWKEDELVGKARLTLNPEILATVRHKKPKKGDEQRVAALTVYAHYLALLSLTASEHIKPKSIPQTPEELRRQLVQSQGSFGFEDVLSYIWNLGIPVLPLQMSGALHGAMWRVNKRNVIVLKQTTRSISRWLIDLLHELAHAKEEPHKTSKAIIETDDHLATRKQRAREEEEATEFALDVALDGRAEELFELCVNEAKGKVEWLKRVVPQVAHRERVDQGVLANALAYRLSQDRISWWGTAAALQDDPRDPWTIARDMFLERVTLDRLNEIDKAILLQALAEDSQ